MSARLSSEPDYLFILHPARAGSTAMLEFLRRSPHTWIIVADGEGYRLESVKTLMNIDPWNTNRTVDWHQVKEHWLKHWDGTTPVMLEKSAPNILRALDIEAHFPRARFIALNRNPYAWCSSGMHRTGFADRKGSVVYHAQTWLHRSSFQKKNIENLQRCFRITYEGFASNVARFADDILDFAPELGRLDKDTHVSVKDYPVRPIKDHNIRQISLLERDEIDLISSILSQNDGLINFFDYEIFSEQDWRDYDAFREKPAYSLEKSKVLRRRGQVAQALDEVSHAVNVHPRHAGLHTEAALLNLQIMRLPDAEKAIAAALSTDGANAQTHHIHARILLKRNRPAEALKAAGQAIALDAANAENYLLRTVALNRLARTGDAIDALERVLALKPTPGARLLLARLRLKQGDLRGGANALIDIMGALGVRGVARGLRRRVRTLRAAGG